MLTTNVSEPGADNGVMEKEKLAPSRKPCIVGRRCGSSAPADRGDCYRDQAVDCCALPSSQLKSIQTTWFKPRRKHLYHAAMCNIPNATACHNSVLV